MSVVLVCLVLSLDLQASQQDRLTLEFKPTSTPVHYWVRTTEKEARHDWNETPKWRVIEGLGLIQRAVQQTPDGKLTVAVSSRYRQLSIENTPVDLGHAISPMTSSHGMTRQGEPTDPAERKDLGSLCSPVFPSEPVTVGHTWRVTVPPSEKFHLPIEVTHTVNDVQTVGGVRCAVLRTVGAAKGTDPAAGGDVRLEFRSWGWLDLDGGSWLKQRTELNLQVVQDKPQPGGKQVLARKYVQSLTRRVTGEASDPGKAAH